MNAVLFGATRGMGRALARQLAARGDRLFLLGRDDEELARSAADLEFRGAAGNVVAGRAGCDLLAPEGFEPALAAAWSALGRVAMVIGQYTQPGPSGFLALDQTAGAGQE